MKAAVAPRSSGRLKITSSTAFAPVILSTIRSFLLDLQVRSIRLAKARLLRYMSTLNPLISDASVRTPLN